MSFIRDNSHEESTYQLARDITDGNLDFLLIDGDHTYKGVKQDFEMYSRLVSEDGIIAFHDIVPNKTSPDLEVHRFWNEIKERYETEEFIADPDQTYAGIGVVRL